jgi:hypothetical protein
VPLLNDLSSEADWVEPDDVPRPLVTYGFASETIGEFELEPHHHAKSQLLLVLRGALTCEIEGALDHSTTKRDLDTRRHSARHQGDRVAGRLWRLHSARHRHRARPPAARSR